MGVISSVTQRVQIGVESTEGTEVNATKELPSIGFDLGVAVENKFDRPSGYKFPTIKSQLKEWTNVKASGIPTYDELVYLFAMAFGAPTFTQIDATTAYRAAFAFSTTNPVTPKTMTIEKGNSTRAQLATGCRLAEIGMAINRGDIGVNGSGYGRALQDGITMTSSPTAIPQIPLIGTDWNVYLDDAPEDLGTTQYELAFTADWKLAGLFNPVWTLDRSLSSYAASVDTAVDGEVGFTVMADSEGMGLLADMRAGTTKFMRIEAVSDSEAGTSEPYSLTLDFAVQIDAPGDFGDENGARVLPFKTKIVHSGEWGKAVAIEVVSTRTAL